MSPDDDPLRIRKSLLRRQSLQLMDLTYQRTYGNIDVLSHAQHLRS